MRGAAQGGDLGWPVWNLSVFRVKKTMSKSKKDKEQERRHDSEICKRLDNANPNLSNSKGTDS
jgi:hypothetical protein